MKKLILCAVFGLFTFVSHVAEANDFQPQIEAYYADNIKSWLSDPALVSAIKTQNDAHKSLSAADVDSLDKQWRAEAKSGGGELISKLLGNELSKFLKGKKEGADGAITEIFAMDNKGLNVGQSDVTSDYMQGDESKWQKTYGSGTDTIFIDEVEFDESSQSFQSQISATIMDGSTPIGAITIGLNVENLM